MLPLPASGRLPPFLAMPLSARRIFVVFFYSYLGEGHEAALRLRCAMLLRGCKSSALAIGVGGCDKDVMVVAVAVHP